MGERWVLQVFDGLAGGSWTLQRSPSALGNFLEGLGELVSLSRVSTIEDVPLQLLALALKLGHLGRCLSLLSR